MNTQVVKAAEIEGDRLEGVAGVGAKVTGTDGAGQSLSQSQGLVVLGKGAVSDGHMTSTMSTDTTSQEATDHGTTATLDTNIETIALALAGTRETDIPIEKGTKIGGVHEQGECVAGRKRTTRLQTINCSRRLASSRSQSKRNRKKARFP